MMVGNLDQARRWFMATAMSFLNTPYVYGGDDPQGLDCSGLVVECLKAVGFIGENEDYSADGLWRLYQHRLASGTREGALLFYLDSEGRAYHVTICLDPDYQIGAMGGTSKTTSTAAAYRDNAWVRIRPIRMKPERMVVRYLF